MDIILISVVAGLIIMGLYFFYLSLTIFLGRSLQAKGIELLDSVENLSPLVNEPTDIIDIEDEPDYIWLQR